MLARLAAVMGGTMIGGQFFLSGCARADKSETADFTPDDIAFLDEVSDTIIPATNTPGAKSAGVGAFMAMIVKDCYNELQHGVFYRGIGQLDAACKKATGERFLTASVEQRTTLLNALDREQQQYTQSKTRNDPPHYFRLMKELAVLGYFSSEAGCTQALRYEESPGQYDGDVPYKKGDRAFFNPSRRFG